MTKYQNPIDALYDEDNDDVIVLFNEKGEEVPFEQIALIPLKGITYAILKPIVPIEGLDENAGLVFSIDTIKETGEEFLNLVTDDDVINDVFDIYDELVE
ncbi:MAG: DUF1292 domain-containing protein [Clostridia bacterium]|nr:DUF1292 domain-containing protein [Clostridia bacterium]